MTSTVTFTVLDLEMGLPMTMTAAALPRSVVGTEVSSVNTMNNDNFEKMNTSMLAPSSSSSGKISAKDAQLEDIIPMQTAPCSDGSLHSVENSYVLIVVVSVFLFCTVPIIVPILIVFYTRLS